MVLLLLQNKYNLRYELTLSCYVTLRTQVIRLNSGNLGPQKTDSRVFIIVSTFRKRRLIALHIFITLNII